MDLLCDLAIPFLGIHPGQTKHLSEEQMQRPKVKPDWVWCVVLKQRTLGEKEGDRRDIGIVRLCVKECTVNH